MTGIPVGTGLRLGAYILLGSQSGARRSIRILIHVTKKLQKKLLPDQLDRPAVAHPLGDWHANLYHIDRRQCVLFVHDRTRFALLAVGLKKHNFENLELVFADLFVNTLMHVPYPFELVECAAGLLHPLTMSFDTQCDRSVLGTMRSLYHQEIYTAMMRVNNVMELLPYSTSVALNKRPTRIKGMKSSECLWPIDAMKKLLEEQVSAGAR